MNSITTQKADTGSVGVIALGNVSLERHLMVEPHVASVTLEPFVPNTMLKQVLFQLVLFIEAAVAERAWITLGVRVCAHVSVKAWFRFERFSAYLTGWTTIRVWMCVVHVLFHFQFLFESFSAYLTGMPFFI